jgi:aspartate aminotransferase
MTNPPSVPVSDAVQRISGSQRGGQALGGAALRKLGIVPLNSGDPNFPTPDYVIEAAAQAMREGYTHYPPQQGDFDLRGALAEQLNEDHGQDFTPDNILITSGGSGAIYTAVVGLLNPGDQCILFNPCFSLYEDVLKMANIEPVWVPFRRDTYHLDPDALEAAITPRTRMIILNSPCNPTSIVLDRSELEAVEQIVLKHNLLLLSDEIYDHLIWDGRGFVSALDLPALAERTLLVNGFSKTFAMTGWRLGYLAGKRGLLDGPYLVNRTMQHSVSWPTQRAALAALAGLQEPWYREMIAAYDRRRKLGHQHLSAVPRFTCALPEAAFYFWVKVDTKMPSVQMVNHFQQHGVAVRSGTEFGSEGEGFVRLTFAASDDDILEGVNRMARAADLLPR